MQNNVREPITENKPRRFRLLILFVLLLGVGVVLFLAGRFIYGLGQRSAARVAGIDPDISATPSFTITPSPTITPTFTPAPTATYEFPPTATETQIPWTSCPGIVITVTDTKKGDLLHVKRCADGLEYDLGPLTKGVYAVSPDDKYLVYCDWNGILYAARIGTTTLTVIRRMNKEFYTFGRNMAPIFELTFNPEKPSVLQINEKRYGQDIPVGLPGWLDE
jgi:hypothetical protein